MRWSEAGPRGCRQQAPRRTLQVRRMPELAQAQDGRLAPGGVCSIESEFSRTRVIVSVLTGWETARLGVSMLADVFGYPSLMRSIGEETFKLRLRNVAKAVCTCVPRKAEHSNFLTFGSPLAPTKVSTGGPIRTSTKAATSIIFSPDCARQRQQRSIACRN